MTQEEQTLDTEQRLDRTLSNIPLHCIRSKVADGELK